MQTIIKEKPVYKIRDLIRQRQSEWKGALEATQNMDKGSHKVFKRLS